MDYLKYRYLYMASDELYHHGIPGMKWGVRRFENADGTLTPEGKARYRANTIDGMSKEMQKKREKDVAKQFTKDINRENKNLADSKGWAMANSVLDNNMYTRSKVYASKAYEYKTKGNVNKAKKYDEKAKDLFNTYAQRKTINDSRKLFIGMGQLETKSIIEDMNANGYRIHSKLATTSQGNKYIKYKIKAPIRNSKDNTYTIMPGSVKTPETKKK